MPGGDRTGPLGMGPATGWGMGRCAGSGQARGANWGPGQPFHGRAGGRAGRQAWAGPGRMASPGGHGWRRWYYATGLPGWARWPAVEDATAGGPAREQEIEALKDEAGWLKDQLDAIARRMDELSQE